MGEDVQPPSSNNTDSDYYNRYYAFGSTRNIVRSDYSSLNASVTSLAEAHLKLPTSDWVDDDGSTIQGCAGGYVDYNDGSGTTATERNACVKVYDDIYPQSDLIVSEVKKTTKKTDEDEEYPVYGLYLKSKATGSLLPLRSPHTTRTATRTGSSSADSTSPSTSLLVFCKARSSSLTLMSRTPTRRSSPSSPTRRRRL